MEGKDAAGYRGQEERKEEAEGIFMSSGSHRPCCGLLFQDYTLFWSNFKILLDTSQCYPVLYSQLDSLGKSTCNEAFLTIVYVHYLSSRSRGVVWMGRCKGR